MSALVVTLLNTVLPLAEKYAPELIGDITKALVKEGYTLQQIGDIYSKVVPYEAFGINPNAPVKPE